MTPMSGRQTAQTEHAEVKSRFDFAIEAEAVLHRLQEVSEQVYDRTAQALSGGSAPDPEARDRSGSGSGSPGAACPAPGRDHPWDIVVIPYGFGWLAHIRNTNLIGFGDSREEAIEVLRGRVGNAPTWEWAAEPPAGQ
jgi:hypothetical protein